MADPNEKQQQHPWAKYYADRGVARPVPVALVAAEKRRVRARKAPAAAEKKPPAMSAELQAAVAAVTEQSFEPGVTAAPFITAMQREAVAREIERRRWWRLARLVGSVVAAVVALHFALSTTLFREPFESSVRAHIRRLPERITPLYSSLRQPLRAEGVTIAQADRLDGSTMRYVVAVTVRLQKPLYVPAVSNGTLMYRRMQEAVVVAREQELRFNLFPASSGPAYPELPLLLQRTHQAGETFVVRVPFMARRFGWHWRLETPPLDLRVASRGLEGDSLDHYARTRYLIFGGPATLPELRERLKQANAYVVAVTKAVQRQAEVVAEEPRLADQPARADDSAEAVAHQPALPPGVDPHAPARTAEANPDAPARPAEVDPNAPALEEPLSPGASRAREPASPSNRRPPAGRRQARRRPYRGRRS